jgi:citrate lyase beta subunit
MLMRARRALLYVPGDDLHKIRKAATLDVDCICLDMEDGVAPNRKAEARRTIAEALLTLDFGTSERLARINSVGSGLETDDLEAVLPSRPDGIVIPKVEYAHQIQKISQAIGEFENRNDWPDQGIRIIAVVESGRAIVNLADVAGADPRLDALIFGAEDYAGDVGATRTSAGWEVFFARSTLVAHTSAFGLQSIDIVHIDFKDIEGLRQEALAGAKLGFDGKQIIHPNQVSPVQEAFTPDEEAIAYARRIVTAFEEHQKAGRGAFALDGKMIDAPIIRSAQRVIGLVNAIAKQ